MFITTTLTQAITTTSSEQKEYIVINIVMLFFYFLAGGSLQELSTRFVQPTCVPGSMQTNEDTVVALLSVSELYINGEENFIK